MSCGYGDTVTRRRRSQPVVSPVPRSPTSRRSYNNTNYVLLALLVEKVPGSSWERAVEQRILTFSATASTGTGDPTPGYFQVLGEILC